MGHPRIENVTRISIFSSTEAISLRQFHADPLLSQSHQVQEHVGPTFGALLLLVSLMIPLRNTTTVADKT